MSALLSWLLLYLHRLKTRLSCGVRGLLALLLKLWRRRPKGPLKPGRGTAHIYGPPKTVRSPAPNHRDEERSRAIVCASYVPRSARSSSSPNVSNIPVENSAHPLPMVSDHSAAPTVLHPTLHAPYMLDVPYTTQSQQDISFYSRPSREAHAEDNMSLSDRLSIRSAIHRPGRGPRTTRISPRAPAHYLVGGGISPIARSRSHSPASSVTQPRSQSSALPIAEPNASSVAGPYSTSGPQRSDSSPVSVRIQNPSESSFALNSTDYNVTAPSDSGHSGATLSRETSRGVDGLALSADSTRVNETPYPSSARASCISLQVPEDWRPQPFSPEETSRYDRENLIPADVDDNLLILPLKTSWPHSTETDNGGWEAASCGDWTPATHPEGGLYFYHPQHRAFTDNYMYDKDERQEVEEFLDCLLGHLSSSWKRLPSDDCELVVETRDDGDEKRGWYYYYIDHKSRGLFWLQPYESPNFLSHTWGKKNPSHAKLGIESEYWAHWALYPVGRNPLPEGTMDELQGMLIACATDTMTSPSSTSPYNLKDLRTFISLIKKAGALREPSRNVHVIWTVARLMNFFLDWKFIHFHGQKHARLDRDLSVHSRECRRRTMLISIFSPISFLAPEVHLTDLEKIWTDQVVNNPTWKPFIAKLLDEWQEFVLYGTVLLNANVAFLDIGYVGDSAKAGIAQFLSYVSIVASAGSIVLGLLLIRQNRSRANREVPKDVTHYLDAMMSGKYGLEPLAIIYSLPYALLMWSMLTFVVAFLIVCFNGSNLPTRVFVGLSFLIVLVAILLCLVKSTNIAVFTWLAGVVERFRVEDGSGQSKLRKPWPASFASLSSFLRATLGPQNTQMTAAPTGTTAGSNNTTEV